MKTKKIIFLILSIIFLVLMVLIGIDISSKTTFPGSKGNLKERIKESNSAAENE
ncbi:hypothetical protein [Echinicola salinicaeni]|uniref:hypothetical protein n=1 Tax=Echinicola salinicaeni TaxID=2762757 RepID=UPI001646FF2B|nr:hypothetical protein [Echinicola salinicaeni]